MHQTATEPAKISGRLDYQSSGLGLNEYRLRDLTVVSGPDYLASTIQVDVVNVLCKLVPNEDGTVFTLNSPGSSIGSFTVNNLFGGTFTKNQD
jgi:hypothetical protein